MKRLKRMTFHGRDIMPIDVGLLDLEGRVLWESRERAGYRFKVGDRVCHRDNTEMCMYVEDIIKKVVMVDSGVMGEDGPVMVRKSRMMGVRCYWYE